MAVVGVNDGRAFTLNPCLTSEARWAGPNLGLYLNVNSPPGVDRTDATGPAGHCPPNGLACLAYNFGFNTALASVAAATVAGVRSPMWWLDVEAQGQCVGFPTANVGYWSCDPSLNSLSIQGAIDLLHTHHLVAGIYTTAAQWQAITGGYLPRSRPFPTWIAGLPSGSGRAGCQSAPVAGNRPSMLQFWPVTGFDVDLVC